MLFNPKQKSLKNFAGEDRQQIHDAVRQQLPLSLEVDDEPAAKRRRLQDDDDDDDDDDVDVATHKDELEMYLEFKAGPCTENVLQWWKDHRHQFPNLAKVARNVLCIQASSAASERNFSVAGNVVNKRRCALTPSSVNDILFLNSVLK